MSDRQGKGVRKHTSDSGKGERGEDPRGKGLECLRAGRLQLDALEVAGKSGYLSARKGSPQHYSCVAPKHSEPEKLEGPQPNGVR